MESGGGDRCFPVLTLLFVCNNNASNSEDKSYRRPKCFFFSPIVKCQTVAGGDKLVKKNTIWLFF